MDYVFIRGRIVQQASQVLALHHAMNKSHDARELLQASKAAETELLRLCDNELQLRNDWGCGIQLAGLIVLLVDGYRSTALD